MISSPHELFVCAYSIFDLVFLTVTEFKMLCNVHLGLLFCSIEADPERVHAYVI